MADKKTKKKKDEQDIHVWNTYSEAEKKKVYALADDYRGFISDCKTERESAAETDGQRARTGESEAAFARMVASALEGVSVRLDGAAVGSLVAPAVSRSIAENAAARRYGTV